MIKPKRLQDFLNDDPSLTKKITYEELKNGQVASSVTDDCIDDVYKYLP